MKFILSLLICTALLWGYLQILPSKETHRSVELILTAQKEILKGEKLIERYVSTKLIINKDCNFHPVPLASVTGYYSLKNINPEEQIKAEDFSREDPTIDAQKIYQIPIKVEKIYAKKLKEGQRIRIKVNNRFWPLTSDSAPMEVAKIINDTDYSVIMMNIKGESLRQEMLNAHADSLAIPIVVKEKCRKYR